MLLPAVDVSDGVTADDVALWMLCQLHRAGSLSHAAAVDGIEQRFGTRFVCENDLGNRAVDPDVLVAFRRIRPGTVMWDGFGKCWRPFLH